MKEYIERSKVLDVVKRTSGDYAAAWAEIVYMPAADVAPMRYGYWMDSSNGWTCSECISDNMRDTKWCPNCGAKMIGVVRDNV